ncbi:MAG: magnesium chelatase [Candidatus Eremiobacteraeota bacterium]|nr:magnesium chelatase [Candidatus Eremiobacteraeota bacterium]
MQLPSTLGILKKSGYRALPVRDEIRKNLLEKIRRGEKLFPGLVGYDKTVIPSLINALLAKHNFILLGLRGQAKSRILRSLVTFLDEYIPMVAGCPLHDSPLSPLCISCRTRRESEGDDLPIEWLHRGERYNEKLATPDVSIADLIGDIDPIKAAAEKRSLSDEEVIHYGIIPRSNRGIFAINELPDLQPRIQVGLLNLLEEGDIQIRGFPVRMPLDMLIAFSANPEDYTNRGNIITPLKDRIDSQIMTHYPRTMADALAITSQEAWLERESPARILIPPSMGELIEEIAFMARESEYVYQSSGVSARLSISAIENLKSNLEKRALLTGEHTVYPRICDLGAVIPSITGKIELVYEGEQEGASGVAKRLIGGAVKKIFERIFPKAASPKPPPRGEQVIPQADSLYREIITWFGKGNRIDLSDEMPWDDYYRELKRVPALLEIAQKHLKTGDMHETAFGMELILEGLHQHSLIAKESADSGSSYFDMLKIMFDQMKGHYEL